jgi:hypothetical protein
MTNYSDKIEQKYINIIKEYPVRYEKTVFLSDKKTDSDESHLFVYLLSSPNELKEILIFQENEKHLLKLIIRIAILDIQPRGLIQFESNESIFINIKGENAFINQVFINIRDLYHEHTHHDGDNTAVADSLLLVSLDNDNVPQALDEILKNFQRKIIRYHKLIKEALKVKHTKIAVETTHSLIRQAKGEFIYAINFVNLYFFKSENHPLYINFFENAIRSIDTFYEETNTKYLFELTETQTQSSLELKNLVAAQNKLSKNLERWTIILIFLTIAFIAVTVYCAFRQESALLAVSDLLSKP